MNNTTINLFNGLELINSLPKQLEYFNINTLPIQDKTIGGLSIAISILMGLLVIASFLLNIAIFITIITSYKLRSSLLYLMFSILSLLNLLDVLLITIIALLFVSNGGLWTFGKTICRVNAFAQQFLFLANLLILTLIAMERALSLIRRHLVTRKIFGSLAIVFMIIPLCFASPLLISGFPVSIYVYRYLCAIGSGSPVLYSIAQLLVYGGCLFVLLICFGSIIKQSRIVRKLPVKPEHYGAFILENRILEEHMQLIFEYAVIQGPYIFLDFFVQISNSIEVQLNKYTNSIISKEVDILVTIIKLFHPLIVPTMILVSCNNIWIQLIDKICCRCSKSVIVGSSNSIAIGGGTNSAFSQLLIDLTNNPNVMTLYATPNGDLQLRLPNATLITQPPAQMVKSINKNDEINERIINKKNKKNFPSTQICTDIEEEEEEKEEVVDVIKQQKKIIISQVHNNNSIKFNIQCLSWRFK
ncbi:hypothetical protein Mgra_00008391 [Meloidogyne graminicola]|uniref:G-protein coupled receptors family 1 profile domain-containing protein n=1 Tax=Meloidogyne graminicola TaxID=189291 RepID=A0A8S9ZFW8_9BILA|nr:hypothetical protein Mgra_00008391 [Meloidogyne graminicola]